MTVFEDELAQIWFDQKIYNQYLRNQSANTREEWSQTYMLGIVSEMDELLREINWKKHRKESGIPVNDVNICFELADITKYIISLWELWGNTPSDMLQFCSLKTEMLNLQKVQDETIMEDGMNIVLLDLDGTIADWRGSFIKWLRGKKIDPVKDDLVSTLMIDVDMEMRYPEYSALKDEFERTGQYGQLIPYSDAIVTVNNLVMDKNAFVIANTARPFSKYKRIWMDTWNWIKRNDILVHQLNMSSEHRILNAHKLNEGSRVVMFDDDPELIIRAANCGIRVFARRQPYNQGVSHKNITFVEKYTDLSVDDYFPEGD